MRRIAFTLAILCFVILPGASEAKTGIDVLDSLELIDITPQKVEVEGNDVFLLNCDLDINGVKGTAESIGLLNLQKNSIGRLRLNSLKFADFSVKMLDYSDIHGNLDDLLKDIALLAADPEEVPASVLEDLRDFRIGNGKIRQMRLKNDGITISLDSLSFTDNNMTSCGRTICENLIVKKGQLGICIIKQLGYDSISFPGLDKMARLDSQGLLDGNLPEEDARMLLSGRVDNLHADGITIPFLQATIEKLVLNYAGGNDEAKGSLRIDNAAVPGELLAEFIPDPPELLQGSLADEVRISVANEVAIDNKLSLLLAPLLRLGADFTVVEGKKGMPAFKNMDVSLEDLGMVQIMPPDLRRTALMLVAGFLPELAGGATDFFNAPGHTLNASLTSDGETFEVESVEVK